MQALIRWLGGWLKGGPPEPAPPGPRRGTSRRRYPTPEIQSLIDWREHILPRGNVEVIGGATDGFRCRPGELLVDAGLETRLASLVHPDLPEPTPIETPTATILHYRSRRIHVPSVLNSARIAPDRDRLLEGIRPNLVFAGEQAYQGFPGDWPRPDGPPSDDFSGESDGPIVAVLDTGYTIGVHESDGLDGRFGSWGPPATPEKIDVTEPRGWRDFEAGHATFICGIIAQRARRARLRLVPTLDSDGFVDEVELVEKIKALGDDVDIVNLSLGGFSPGPGFSPDTGDAPPIALRAAIASLRPETVVVAAAGNAGPREERPFWPAQLDARKKCEEKVVFSIGALDENGTPAVYSTEPADLYAPGRMVSAFIEFDETDKHSTARSGRDPQTFEGYASWAGTSFATAVIAAKIADEMADGRSALTVARELCHNENRPF